MTQAIRLGECLSTASHHQELFTLPLDMVAQKLALTGVSGSGKTCTGFVLAEELYEAKLPFIVFDPPGNFWGLRATVDGKPSHRKIVVIGGDHADLPLERDSGAKIAEAIINANASTVIDFKLESKATFRKFGTDFVEQLMRMMPEIPWHIFLEEAKELVPQKPVGPEMKRTYAAFEKFVIQGRNFGYGFTLLGQRPATINKDVLSQCETVIVMRTGGSHDRKAYKDWFEARGEGLGEEVVEHQLKTLSQLGDGQAYVWSPHWLKQFVQIQVRQRTCFHPGETRRVGTALKRAELVDVDAFVQKLKHELARKVVPVGATGSMKAPEVETPLAKDFGKFMKETEAADRQVRLLESQVKDLSETVTRLTEESESRGKLLREADHRLAAVRRILQPQYDAMRTLFENLTVINAVPAAIDTGTWGIWLDRAKGGRRKMLEVMIQRKELTKKQLATLAGLSPRSVNDYMAWFTGNGLLSASRGRVKLNEVPA